MSYIELLDFIVVEFYGAKHYVTDIEGKPYVAIDPKCGAIGFISRSQFDEVWKSPSLNSQLRVRHMLGDEGEVISVICFPLENLNQWLDNIDESKIESEETKSKLVYFREECFDRLFTAWTKSTMKCPTTFAKNKTCALSRAEEKKLMSSLCEQVKATVEVPRQMALFA